MSLFSIDDIRRARGPRPDRLEKIIIGIDPPATPHAATCGIVVAGRDMGRAYVLADLTCKSESPRIWADHIVQAAHHFEADLVVNYGGEEGKMLRPILGNAGLRCPLGLRQATRSQHFRAEPVAALYDAGRVIHCADGLGPLEDELLNLGRHTPADRAEALIAALTELLLVRAPVTMRAVH